MQQIKLTRRLHGSLNGTADSPVNCTSSLDPVRQVMISERFKMAKSLKYEYVINSTSVVSFWQNTTVSQQQVTKGQRCRKTFSMQESSLQPLNLFHVCNRCSNELSKWRKPTHLTTVITVRSGVNIHKVQNTIIGDLSQKSTPHLNNRAT